ncbi:unnamed protein product [Malus baccata var. baccata]
MHSTTYTHSIVTNQLIGALNRNIEKLLHSDMRTSKRLNTSASMNVNKLLDEIGSLKKLLENQAIVPDLNASTNEDSEEDEPPKENPDNDDQVEEHTHDKDTATEDPVQENTTENDVAMEDPKQRHTIDHDPNENKEDQANEDQEHEGKDITTAKGTSGVQQDQGKDTAKKKTRTLVKNIRKRDDCKPNKVKYIYAVSDSESPSIVLSESQSLEPIIEKGKEEPKVESPLNPIAKEIANKPAKKDVKKSAKQKLDKRYHLPASTKAYKLLEDETKEKFKEYYRQEKMDYFWMQPRQRSMATDLVVQKIDMTSLFNDMKMEKSKSDQVHIDQPLKTVLQDNVDKVGKVFILIKHYFHFSLVVWDIKNEKMTHYNSKLPRRQNISVLQRFQRRQQPHNKYSKILNMRTTKEGLVMQEGKTIEATFEKEKVFAKRAQIATTLVNHDNSYANGLKKILEDRRRQNKHGQYDDILDEDFITLA